MPQKNSNRTFSFQLIENTYDLQETREIIHELINRKVSIIETQIESLRRRYALESPFLEDRLSHLLEAKSELEQFLDQIPSDDYEVMIDCPINLELSPVQEEDLKEKEAGIPLSEIM